MTNKDLIITKEDHDLLIEMKENCLNKNVYDDEKRLLKANALTKYLMLEQKVNEVLGKISHELYGHIIPGYEVSWNPEFYEDNKLSYRKLLIWLLEKNVLDTLGYDFSKSWWEYDE